MEPQANRPRPGAGAAAGAGDHGGADGAGDVLEMGGHPPRLPRRGAHGAAIGIALVALAVGLLLGVSGSHHKPAARARPSPAPAALATLPSGYPAIAETGNRCAVQLGHALQLGIEVVNQSGRAAVLRRVTAVLPINGLRPVASQWGPCGLLPGPGGAPAAPALSLAPGATGWLAVTFDVTVRCPQPLPVGFKVSYLQAGRPGTVDLSSFPDLGQVRYGNCRRNPLGG